MNEINPKPEYWVLSLSGGKDSTALGLEWLARYKADLNATFGVANHIRRSRQTGLPQIKKVIYSGPKTIILWADNTKTIVSCGEADAYDYYSGFCAAVVKKLFGSTTHAKKVLGDSIQIND